MFDYNLIIDRQEVFKTTDDLSGLNDLYFTDQRAIDAVKEYPSTFSNVVNLTKDQFQKHQVAGAINYELGTDTHIVGVQRRDVLVADGINKPTFDLEFTVAYDGYNNTSGVKNLIIFEYVDDNEVLVYIQNIS